MAVTIGLGLALVLLSVWNDLTMPYLDVRYREAVEHARLRPEPKHETLNKLLALNPVPIWREYNTGLNEPQAIGYVWLPEDLRSWERSLGDSEWLNVTYDDGGHQGKGWIQSEDTQLFLHRSELVTAKSPASADLNFMLNDPEDYYGLNLAVWRDFEYGQPKSAHPIPSTLVLRFDKVWPYFLVLLTSLLIILAKLTGQPLRRKLEGKFLRAAKRGWGVTRIGGKPWIYSNGEFFHLDGGPYAIPALQWGHVQRWNLAAACDFGRSAIAFVLPLIFLVRWDHEHYEHIREPLIDFVVAVCVAILAWEILYSWGVQWIPGAMVLDPLPRSVGTEDVNEQKAFGDTKRMTEADAVAGTSGTTTPRHPVHDQEF